MPPTDPLALRGSEWAQRTRWPRRQHVIFDCDATLSAIEGIDVLADGHPDESEVVDLTESAMAGTRPLEEVYGRRLEALQPTSAEVVALKDAYKRHAVEGAREVVAALLALDHDVYVVSGGLADPVREFAVHLGIAEENVHAVETNHDRLGGSWWLSPQPAEQAYASHHDGALTTANGKAEVISSILSGRPGGSALIGDGASDAAARDAVDLFVGFGGVAPRSAVREQADLYIEHESLFPVLPIVAGTAALAGDHRDAVPALTRGVEVTCAGGVSFRDDRHRVRFAAAFADAASFDGVEDLR